METTAYLGGGTHAAWRPYVEQRLTQGGIRCYDPIGMSRQDAMCEFVPDDLEAIRKSTFLFVVHDEVDQLGTALEMGFAYALNIPIVYVCLLRKIESMQAGVAKVIFTDIPTAIRYALARYA